MTRRALLFGLGLLLCCTLAAVQGVRATYDLEWPGDPDLIRDISAAETIQSGHLLSDPFYRDEWAWYNPLVPSMVATVSALLNSPVHRVYARLGAYANLLAPVSFFVLLGALFDGPVALAGTIAFLFLVPGNEPAWTTATYSPWLLPVHFVQSLFYLSLLAIARAWNRPAASSFILAGAALGGVVLGHTAPALIVIVLVTTDALHRFVTAAPGERKAFALHFAALVAAAVVVAAPLLLSIIGHYRLTIRNSAPSDWVYPDLALANLGTFLRPTAGALPLLAITSVGALWLFRSRGTAAARLLIHAIAVTTALFVWSYLVQRARALGIQLPALVPGFHFLYYLHAFESMAFGIGVVWLARWLTRLAAGLIGTERAGAVESVAMAMLFGCLGWIVFSTYDAYRSRPDFTEASAGAHRFFSTPELRAMRDWILTATGRADVFVAPDNLGLAVIATAGRKVVAVDAVFSNPFIDWNQRHLDRDRMLDLLQEGDWPGFSTLARPYGVRYVATDAPLKGEAALRCCVKRAWTGGQWIVYEVD